MALSNLSGCIVVYNESKVLRRALESLRRVCDEIVLFDSYSTDSTLQIAESYGCRIFQHEFDNHRDQKNRAIEQCKRDWIILLDADEYCSNTLIELMPEMVNNQEGIDAWTFARYNILDGNGPVGWPDYQTRVFKNYVRHGGNPFHHETNVNAKRIGIVEWPKEANVNTHNIPMIYHDKDMDRQRRQNRLYYSIRPGDYRNGPPDGAEDIKIDPNVDPNRFDVNVYQEYIKKYGQIS